MDNETYLQISYFVVCGCSLAVGLLTYRLLRHRFRAVCDAAPRSRLAAVTRPLFLFGTVVPAFLGFGSVSYFSCTQTSYAQIVANRAHLIQVNFDQLQAAMAYSIVAVFIWCLIVLGIVLTAGK